MANLLVTWRCNRRCTYCFARDLARTGTEIADNLPRSEVHISPQRFEEALAFFQRSKLSVVGILGGEPCLHPDFPVMVERLLAAGIKLRLFTGGVFAEETARFLAQTDAQQVHIVINMPGPADLGSPAADELFWNTMRRLAGRGALGYTIRAPEEDLRFLAELANQYEMRHPLRLGLASPCIDDPAPTLLPPARYPQVAQRVLELAEACARRHVTLELDCGFPRCMFSDTEHARLRALDAHAVFRCGPIVDIGPDLSTWSCFPLKAMGEIPLTDVDTRDELLTQFGRQQRAYRNLGIYDHCMTCPHKYSGECSGGCLAHVVRSFHE